MVAAYMIIVALAACGLGVVCGWTRDGPGGPAMVLAGLGGLIGMVVATAVAATTWHSGFAGFAGWFWYTIWLMFGSAMAP